MSHFLGKDHVSGKLEGLTDFLAEPLRKWVNLPPVPLFEGNEPPTGLSHPGVVQNRTLHSGAVFLSRFTLKSRTNKLVARFFLPMATGTAPCNDHKCVCSALAFGAL